ncbi:hypothetical protein [Parachryseolinea silvisoli]|uniref:hypothetical protein n=1 Tax=Parachryseolinea silvisoli TaxID=2873601 RepID=UPI002265A180|nr:hypothetical protein [Parachryseolinea silvisoli]MCD9015165.1 hypothetical protein [Parachryseolinea silvisoli]
MISIRDAVSDFFTRYPYAVEMGRFTTATELDSISSSVRKVIPRWYQELLREFPLVDMEVGIPYHFGQEQLQAKKSQARPLFPLRILSVGELAQHALETHPGMLLLKRHIPFQSKYIPFANDDFSTGETIFIDAGHPNPAPMLIMHDMGHSARQLLKQAEVLTPSFSDFFLHGRLTNSLIRLNDGNRAEAVARIRELFTFTDAGIAATPVSKFDKEMLTDRIIQRDNAWTAGEYLKSLSLLENALYDSNFPITTQHLERLREIYGVCGLHLPELSFLEDRLPSEQA